MIWDLKETNPFDGPGGNGWFEPTGPEVLPGSYEVRVRVGEESFFRILEVLPDPRV